MVHRLYADEHFPLQVVVALRQLGHDVLTTQDSGHAGQAVSDPAILTFATSQQRPSPSQAELVAHSPPSRHSTAAFSKGLRKNAEAASDW